MIDKTNVKIWIEKNRGGAGYGTIKFDFWDNSIWKKTYEEIVEYITKRFEKTKSELEYYYCLLYLEKHLHEKLKYLPYKESDQYKRAIGIKVESKDIRVKSQSLVTKAQMFSIER